VISLSVVSGPVVCPCNGDELAHALRRHVGDDLDKEVEARGCRNSCRWPSCFPSAPCEALLAASVLIGKSSSLKQASRKVEERVESGGLNQ
jgi:hypothetical protein